MPTTPRQGSERSLSKLQAATRTIAALLDHLTTNDRFGLVLFDSDSRVAIPLQALNPVCLAAQKGKILSLATSGSTNLEAGLATALAQFAGLPPEDPDHRENRIILLTDAMPNTGNISLNRFTGLVDIGARTRIYTTFLAIGLDANTTLVSELSRIRGANFYSVRSPAEFEKRLNQEFAYMVTPLVFNLRLRLEAEGYDIQRVIGSPDANLARGDLMTVNTLFPAPVTDGLAKGGIILMQVAKRSPQARIRLVATYEDRSGRIGSSTRELFIEKNPETFDNCGIRKAVLLTRHADLLKSFALEARRGLDTPPRAGWETASMRLHCPPATRPLIERFRAHFVSEIRFLEDKTLAQELELMTLILGSSPPSDSIARAPQPSSPPGL